MSSLEMRFPALLAPELAQLREDPRVLEEGTAPVAVYMRYSSERLRKTNGRTHTKTV